MNNQPLPKPSQANKGDDLTKSSGVAATPNLTASVPTPSSSSTPPSAAPVSPTTPSSTPPPSAASTPPPSALNTSSSSKQGVVFDGEEAKTRIPLAQKSSDETKPSGELKPTEEITLPPTSLSALSSMSSNIIPNAAPEIKPEETGSIEVKVTEPEQAEAPIPKPSQEIRSPEKTVLGRPIPQAIRGEELPKGLTSPVPSPRVVQEKSSPMPVVSENSDSYIHKGDKPKFATEKKSVLKFLPFIVGGIAILIVIAIVISKLFGGGGSTSLPKQNTQSGTDNTGANQANSGETAKRTEVPAEQTELVYWGLWEPDEVMDEIITSFEASIPGTKINYVQQSHKDYRERLQTALSTKEGPDIFRYHASWAPMLKADLSPIPASAIPLKEFKENYYPIVTDQLVVEGQYVGVPLMYDGLALYYNEDILESASETPPTTWAELRLLAAKLTVKSANGIERAGLAIGNTVNVEHFSDILAVLMLQNGASFSDPNSQETRDALLFYTNFVSKDGVWDDKLPSSTVAFARGDVAMMFAPSWRAHEIALQNPKLRFKTMTLPQLSDERIAWGSYWAEGINSNSSNLEKEVAAEFLKYLNKDENLMKLFSKASEIRAFGEIYPKANMAEKLVDNPIVAPYLDDAPYAKSWYLNSYTHDNGINDQMIKYYEDAINAILGGEDIEEVILTIESGTKQVLKQYGISSK